MTICFIGAESFPAGQSKTTCNLVLNGLNYSLLLSKTPINTINVFLKINEQLSDQKINIEIKCYAKNSFRKTESNAYWKTEIVTFTKDTSEIKLGNYGISGGWMFLDEAKCETLIDTKAIVPLGKKTIVVQNKFKDDFIRLFHDETQKDFTFKVAENEIKAHKLILSARSPVFRKMFESNMVENTNNFIQITDASFEAVKLFLEYVYFDKYEDESLASELLYLGDKYEVLGLKDRATNSLMKRLDANNAIDILVLFDRHNVSELVEEVVYFVAEIKDTAYPDEKRSELEKNCPILAEKIKSLIYAFNRMKLTSSPKIKFNTF